MWKKHSISLQNIKKLTLKTKHLAYNYFSSDILTSCLVSDDLENGNSTVR